MWEVKDIVDRNGLWLKKAKFKRSPRGGLQNDDADRLLCAEKQHK